MVVIILGLPGSGKSYFAERLAKMIDAEYINSDRLRKEIFLICVYSDKEKAKVYDMMLQKMKDAIQHHKNLVLDATFHKNETRKPFVTQEKENLFFVQVWADESIIKERLKRNRPYSDADFEVYQRLQQEWEPLEEPHLLLESTDGNIHSMLQKAAQYLGWDDDKKTD
ncbi:AAA family ATPase [Ulvibacterium marinum]|uniref:ATP-binding protein n=1 Tax=Ulvibacterium marinum TaxID=2419782 RepID=A0A3B0C6W4_9FLAO|nr:AAA family ATPase [Ulvibacterium marinum]RKN80224.1 ATP-binding protein [Ulvibacterium marinum]